MSVDYHVYVGPYIQVYNPPKKTTEEYHGCNNHKCSKYQEHNSAKFCAQCGEAITLLKKPTKEPIDFDCYEEFDDKLTELFRENAVDGKPDCQFFGPNQGKIGNHFYAYDTTLIEINETIVIDQLNRLRTTFAKEIKRLEEVFGKQHVIVSWGICGYAS